MSAATASARARERALPRADLAHCQAPHFFFRALARFCNYTQHVCVGLILDSTVGWKKRQWTRAVTAKDFADKAGVTQRMAEIELEALQSEDMGWIEKRPGKRKGTWEYRLRLLLPKAGKQSDPVEAKCGECKTIGAMDADRGFCRTPHSYFQELPACVTRSVWLVVGMVLDETVGWQDEWATLSVEDFMRDTGLSRRAVQEALAEAKKLGLIGEQESAGRASQYRAYPEKFGDLPRASAREVTQPANRNKGCSAESAEEAAPNTENVAPEPINTESTRAVEFVSIPIRRCRNCQAVGPWKEVSSEVVGGRFQPDSIPPTPGDEARANSGASPPSAASKSSQKIVDVAVQDPKFALFWKLFEAAGKALNFQDKIKTYGEWKRYDDPTRDSILRWVAAQMKSAWGSEQYTPMPFNALKSQGWTRVAAERVIPDVKPKSKMDQMWDAYNEMFVEEDKTTWGD